MGIKDIFRRSHKPSVEDLEKRHKELGEDLESLKSKLTMEEEVYSKGTKFARILKNADLNKIPH